MNSNYSYAILCMLGYGVTSVINDSLTKYLMLGQINAEQLVCLRYIFGALTLVIPLLYFKMNLRTKFLHLHALRGFFLIIGMNLYTKSLSILPLGINIIGCFAIPLLVSVLAWIILKEEIKRNIFYTLLSFVGIIISFLPMLNGTDIKCLLPLLFAITTFASLDIMNKNVLNQQEPTLLIMFYTALFAAMFSCVLTLGSNWCVINSLDIINGIILGIGGNLVFWFLLQSFKYAPVSVVQPFKYLEMPLSFGVGYFLFNEPVNIYGLIGGGIICASAISALKR